MGSPNKEFVPRGEAACRPRASDIILASCFPDINPMLDQCVASVCDAGHTLTQHRIDVLCSLGSTLPISKKRKTNSESFCRREIRGPAEELHGTLRGGAIGRSNGNLSHDLSPFKWQKWPEWPQHLIWASW